MQHLAREATMRVGKRLPDVGHRVLVICRQFTCLGYRDERGIWRDDRRREALEDVAAWMECTETIPIAVRETIQLPEFRLSLGL
jgi:hypothetical protein